MYNGFNRKRAVPIQLPSLARLVITAFGIFLASIFVYSDTAFAATFTVNTTTDTIDAIPGNGTCADATGKCSVRAAIMESNTLAGADTINIPAGTYTLTLAGANENVAMTGDLDIRGDLTIIGAGGDANGDPSQTILQAGTDSANAIDRVLEINPDLIDMNVTIRSVWIRYGKDSFDPVTLAGGGGGVLGDPGNGTLLISNSIISDSRTLSGRVGGGAYLTADTGGTVRVEKSVIENNSSDGGGGGLAIGYGSGQVSETTVSGNTTTDGSGGGILLESGSVTIEYSTISGNSAKGSFGNGGGLSLKGPSTVQNVTISGNSAVLSGGGLYLEHTSSTFNLKSNTLTNNRADADNNSSGSGGGLHVQSGSGVMHNTIVADNYKGSGATEDDLSGTLHATSSYNLIGTGGSGGLSNGTNGNQTGVSDPGLGALADNGGSTQTHALLIDSKALDAGSNALALGSTDQRGFTRTADSADANSTATADIGAYEAHPTIENISNRTIERGSALNLSFQLGDSSLGFQSIQGTSSNQTLVPDSNIQITGTGSSRTLQITPATGQLGTANITVTVTALVNGTTQTASDAFQLTVVDTTAPAVNSVAVPANGTYTEGQNLDFVVTFNEAVTVNTAGGTPTLALTIGTTTANATYVSGSGTSALTFGYSVQDGDEDTDGIALGTALALQGGTIRDAAGNNAVLTLNSVASTAGVLVDAASAKVNSVTAPANGTYVAGQNLDFTVTYSEAVTVNTAAGIPSIPLSIGSSSANATYVSGSGTSNLLFRYPVQTGDDDADGITVGAAIALNGGTIKDGGGDDAKLPLHGVGSTSSVLVDAAAPAINTVAVPANGEYRAGQNLDFTVTFSEAVTVNTAGGTPTLSLTLGSATADASYVSGSGSTALTFRYTVQTGDSDSDGITVGASIALNGGTIRDTAGNDANLTLNGVGNTAEVLVDTTAPVVNSVTVPADGTYITGQHLDFIVNASEAITVSTAGGTPYISLTVGGSTVHAAYVSGSGTGSLLFRYSVQNGLLDGDGISVGTNIVPNGGFLRDGAGNDIVQTLNGVGATANVFVDAIAPQVTSVTVPPDATYVALQHLDFTVNVSEQVTVDTAGGTPAIVVTIGSTPVQALYVAGSGTNALLFRYTVQTGNQDADGIELGSTIITNGGPLKDAAGNDIIGTLNGAGSTANILVDATDPQVTSVTVPVDKVYDATENLEFTLHFTESVAVNTAAGTPSLSLTIGGATKQASYVSGTGTNDLLFRYTVQTGDNDTDGITLGANINANGGTIKDAAGNNAALLMNGVGSTANVKVDSTVPEVTEVTVPADGAYRAGQHLNFTVAFSENVEVNTTGGTPYISLTIGGTTVNAPFVSGSGTTQLLFRYTVQAGDEDPNGIVPGAAIVLNGGTIKDAAGRNAVLTLNNARSTAGVLVDTTPPQVPTISNANGVVFPSSEVTFTGQGEPGNKVQLIVDHLPQATGTVSGGGTWSITVNNLTEGSHLIKATATDQAGNTNESAELTFTVKFPTPIPIPSKPELQVSETAWTRENVTVAILGDAGNQVQYKIGEGDWSTYTGELVISQEGTTQITARQLNAELRPGPEESAVVRIDKTAPVITLHGYADMTVYAGSSFDDPGATAVDNIATNVNVKAIGSVDSSTVGEYAIQYQAEDWAGNQAVVERTVKVVPLPTGVYFDEAAYTVKSGHTVEVKVFISYADGREEEVTNESTFTVEKPEIAEISSDGKLKGLADGTTLMTATYGEHEAVATVTVTSEPEPEVLSFNSPFYTLQRGESARFTVKVKHSDGREENVTAMASYQLENPDIAAIDSTGTILGLKTGTTQITAEFDGLTAKATVTVTPEPESRELYFNKRSFTVKRSERESFQVKVKHPADKVEDVTASASYQIADPEIATIDSPGTILGLKKGTTQITAEFDGLTAKARVTVQREDRYDDDDDDDSSDNESNNDRGNDNSSDQAFTGHVISGNGNSDPLTIREEDIEKGHAVLKINDKQERIVFHSDVIGNMLKKNQHFTIDIQTPSASMQVPLGETNQNDLRRSTIEIVIRPAQDTIRELIERKTRSLGASLLARPMEYQVIFSDEQKQGTKAQSFSQYLTRTLVLDVTEIPQGATGVLWDPVKQEFRFVPTTFAKKDGRWIAVMKAKCSKGIFTVVNHSVSFQDMSRHWAKQQVETLAAKFIVQGRSSQQFDPNGRITRAELVSMLMRSLETCDAGDRAPLRDISGKWYEQDVNAAYQAGIITGYADGTFRAEQTVTREEMIVMVIRALSYTGYQLYQPTDENVFEDQDEISGWALNKVLTAVRLQIVLGDQQRNFRPKDQASRAEATAMIVRMLTTAGFLH